MKKILPAACLTLLSIQAFAIDTNNVISSVNKNVGQDQIPCQIIELQRPVDKTGKVNLEMWVAYNFGNDVTKPVHVIADSFHETTVHQKEPALLFKTFERDELVQNLVLDNGKTLTLLKTPHMDGNEDGNSVFAQVLDGFAVAPSADTQLDRASYAESLSLDAPTAPDTK